MIRCKQANFFIHSTKVVKQAKLATIKLNTNKHREDK